MAELEKQIEKLAPGSNDTVVLDLLSNSAYIGTNDEGLPLPAFRAWDGSYRNICSLTTKNVGQLPPIGQIAEKYKGSFDVSHSPLCQGKMLC